QSVQSSAVLGDVAGGRNRWRDRLPAATVERRIEHDHQHECQPAGDATWVKIHILIRLAIAALMLSAPLRAQVDFAGAWAPLFHEDLPDRIPGPELGDYTGIPINEAARMRADSYDADRLSVVSEYECRPHGADYSMRGLSNMRIDNILDPVTQRVIAIHTRMSFQEMERTIWLDGRPHTSEYAPHTWQGFTTGS